MKTLGSVDLDRAVELIVAKQKADAPVAHYEEMPVQKGTGTIWSIYQMERHVYQRQ